jgi:hypothetical protein
LPRHIIELEKPYWVTAYAAAVSDALGRSGEDAWTFPEAQFKDIVSLIEQRCPDRSRIADWLAINARAFTDAVVRLGDKESFWSNFGPRGLVRWLNEKRPGYKANRASADSAARVKAAEPVILSASPSSTLEQVAEHADAAVAALEALDGLTGEAANG